MTYFDNKSGNYYESIIPEDTSDLLSLEDFADIVIKGKKNKEKILIFGSQHLSSEMKKMLGIKNS